MIRFEQIHKSYKVGASELEVLKGVSFDIQRGELVSVMGASGSGKSTAMNIMGLLDVPSRGRYLFEGEDASEMDTDRRAYLRGRKMGFVFQQFMLLDRFNALDNIALPLTYHNVERTVQMERASRLLEQVGLADRAEHRPGELSGGQKQRIAIARALVGEPIALFADEPTGALDSQVGNEIMELFIELNRRQNLTIIIVTHDLEVARRCHRQMVLKDGLLIDDYSAED